MEGLEWWGRRELRVIGKVWCRGFEQEIAEDFLYGGCDWAIVGGGSRSFLADEVDLGRCRSSQ